jgi:hypothetical protein
MKEMVTLKGRVDWSYTDCILRIRGKDAKRREVNMKILYCFREGVEKSLNGFGGGGGVGSLRIYVLHVNIGGVVVGPFVGIRDMRRPGVRDRLGLDDSL